MAMTQFDSAKVHNFPVRSDLQSERIEYQHFQCGTNILAADYKSLYSVTAGLQIQPNLGRKANSM